MATRNAELEANGHIGINGDLSQNVSNGKAPDATPIEKVVALHVPPEGIVPDDIATDPASLQAFSLGFHVSEQLHRQETSSSNGAPASLATHGQPKSYLTTGVVELGKTIIGGSHALRTSVGSIELGVGDRVKTAGDLFRKTVQLPTSTARIVQKRKADAREKREKREAAEQAKSHPTKLSELERLRAEYGLLDKDPTATLQNIRDLAKHAGAPLPDFSEILQLSKDEQALLPPDNAAYRTIAVKRPGTHRIMQRLGMGKPSARNVSMSAQPQKAEAVDAEGEILNFSTITPIELGVAPHTSERLGIQPANPSRRSHLPLVRRNKSLPAQGEVSRHTPLTAAIRLGRHMLAHPKDAAYATTAVGLLYASLHIGERAWDEVEMQSNIIIPRRNAAERATELSSPLRDASTQDGTALTIYLTKLQRQVDLLLAGTEVTIGESIPYPDDPNMVIQTDLFRLTSGKQGVEYLDETLAQKAQLADVSGGVLPPQNVQLTNYSPEQIIEVTFTRSDGVLVSSMEFEADYTNVSQDKDVPVLVESSLAVEMLKTSAELTEVAKRFSALDLGTLVVISNWPEDADNAYYTYIPDVGPAVNAKFIKLPEQQQKEILYRAFGEAMFVSYASSDSETMNQYSELIKSLVDDAINGLPPEDPTLHQDAFAVIDSINGHKTPYLIPPENFDDEEVLAEFTKRVFEESVSVLFLHTDALLARYNSSAQCNDEQDYITRQNLSKLLRFALLVIQAESGPNAVRELYGNDDKLLSRLWFDASVLIDTMYSQPTPDTVANIHKPSPTPRDTSTPNPYYSPTPQNLEDVSDTEGKMIWQSPDKPTPTETPTQKPTNTPTPTRTPDILLTGEAKKIEQIPGDDTNSLHRSLLPDPTATSTSTPTPGPPLEQVCNS